MCDRGDGYYIKPDTLTQAFRRVVARLEQEGGPRFHDLRHAFGTMLMERNTHPKVASEMPGHSTVSFTMDTYQHVQSTIQQSAAQAIEEALGDSFS